MAEITQKIADIENDKRAKLVHDQYVKDKAKLDKLRLQIAKKNYAISGLQRQVDDIPTRIELLQYQKRFEELHQQTRQVHTETKQFYALFNNLSDTKTYLEKHLVRLNSINENFRWSVGDVEKGMLFLDQFEQIVAGAKQSKSGIEKRRDEVKTNKDSLNDEYLKLVEEGRRYYVIVKEFQDECKKTEMLIAKCKEMGIWILMIVLVCFCFLNRSIISLIKFLIYFVIVIDQTVAKIDIYCIIREFALFLMIGYYPLHFVLQFCHDFCRYLIFDVCVFRV